MSGEINLVAKIIPKNNAFVGLVDATQVIGKIPHDVSATFFPIALDATSFVNSAVIQIDTLDASNVKVGETVSFGEDFFEPRFPSYSLNVIANDTTAVTGLSAMVYNFTGPNPSFNPTMFSIQTRGSEYPYQLWNGKPGNDISFVQGLPSFAFLADRTMIFAIGSGFYDTTQVLYIDGARNLNVGDSTAITQKLHVAGDVDVDVGRGYRINNTASAGHYLRGDGTHYADATVRISDVDLSGLTYGNVPVKAPTNTFVNSHISDTTSAFRVDASASILMTSGNPIGDAAVFQMFPQSATGPVFNVIAIDTIGNYAEYALQSTPPAFLFDLADSTGNTASFGVTINKIDFQGNIHAQGHMDVSSGYGYSIANTAPAGHYLRGDGSHYVDATIGSTDVNLSGVTYGRVPVKALSNSFGNSSIRDTTAVFQIDTSAAVPININAYDSSSNLASHFNMDTSLRSITLGAGLFNNAQVIVRGDSQSVQLTAGSYQDAFVTVSYYDVALQAGSGIDAGARFDGNAKNVNLYAGTVPQIDMNGPNETISLSSGQASVIITGDSSDSVVINGNSAITLGSNSLIAMTSASDLTLTSGSGTMTFTSQSSKYAQNNGGITLDAGQVTLYGSTDATVSIGSGISLACYSTSMYTYGGAGITLQTGNFNILLTGLTSVSSGLPSNCLYFDASGFIKIKP